MSEKADERRVNLALKYWNLGYQYQAEWFLATRQAVVKSAQAFLKCLDKDDVRFLQQSTTHERGGGVSIEFRSRKDGRRVVFRTRAPKVVEEVLW